MRIVIIDDNRFMADIIQNSSESFSLYLSIFLSLLNVGSRSSSIMILENRIRLIEIQLRCQTLFNSPRNKSERRRRRMNSGTTLFVAWRRLLRNYVTVINLATINDANRLFRVITANYRRCITNWDIEFYASRVIQNEERNEYECLIDETRREVRNSYLFMVNIRSVANMLRKHLWKNVIWI